ncbi:hypothetical protein EUZ85_21155 [Hahella sp. KA22]|uniref:HzsA-related protein n=1 Tax=Hahella sp. KA22 TaxID=1628392 RepID=UPI000FDDBC0E|nr:PD40 domain-containing protein [Hahella sp. KA22]AZZ93105.1 hypothetical protein ENC22_18570 [Hahella sp. KA22]QAY56479.1 hypothetical protein EUZ85_21155 [Hahella sp. KA22]
MKMIKTPPNDTLTPGDQPLLRVFSLSILSAALAACGGGIGGANQGPDPVVQDIPIAYVKRPLVRNDDGALVSQDARTPIEFRPGAVLYIRSQASPSATARDISSQAFQGPEFLNDEGQLLYDVKDVDVSSDGSKIIFAMRAPEIEDADEDEQPTWNIWEYDVAAGVLERVIASDNVAEAGDDMAPHYLPDGRIVFTSTRQRQSQAILLDEGKPQFEALNEDRRNPAMVLHVIDPDTDGIKQITFNQSSDLDPVVTQDGKIVFTRWDNMGGNNSMNLYRVNPDGTGFEYLYGRHSHDTGSSNGAVQFLKPVALEDGRIMVSLRPYVSSRYGGALVAIDVANFTEHDQPTYENRDVLTNGQTALTPNDVSTDDEVQTLAGTFNSAYPMWDGTGRLLVSWSQCRLLDTDNDIVPCTNERLESADYQPAPPLYGLWIYNAVDGTQLPVIVPTEDTYYTDAVVLQSRTRADFIPDGDGPESDLGKAGYGVVHIRSVYDIDGTDTTPAGIGAMADPVQTSADNRPARFLRVVKAVSMPDRDIANVPGTAFGASAGQLMREILGYVPIEPDGSVKFAVPANVAFAVSIVDKAGKRASPRHQNWLQVRPGETLECIGCHTANSELPHGRPGAQAPSINTGAATTGQPFPNTDPALFTNMGETMAETFARINGLRYLNPDIVFDDEWTDANITAKAESFSYAYADLATTAPISTACATPKDAKCRVVINYATHIHPLWGKVRQVLDDDGTTVLADHTCNSCHGLTDAMAAVQVPAAQLDLSDGPSTDQADHLKSYRELLFNDAEQEIIEGVLVDRQIPVLDGDGNPVFETDGNGDLILDDDGNPIPVMTTVAVNRSMTPQGSVASTRFFAPFQTGGSHEGWLDPVELKLISEWLDIGAQYYNNPFDVPQD